MLCVDDWQFGYLWIVVWVGFGYVVVFYGLVVQVFVCFGMQGWCFGQYVVCVQGEWCVVQIGEYVIGFVYDYCQCCYVEDVYV